MKEDMQKLKEALQFMMGMQGVSLEEAHVYYRESRKDGSKVLCYDIKLEIA